MKLCDRNCTGFQCPGDRPATECSVTGCDTRIACQGSVNCVVDNCDADCKGIFFDSAGMVLEECTGGKGTPEPEEEGGDYEGEGVSMVGEPLTFTMAPTAANVSSTAADMDLAGAGTEEEDGGEEGVSMVGEPLVQTMSPTPTVPPTSVDQDVEAADSDAASSDAAVDSTATATVTTTSGDDEATTTAVTDGTPATTTTSDAAEAEASSATTVSIVSSGRLFSMVVVAMTGLVLWV